MKNRNAVTVLIPPAVPTGDPPMNISRLPTAQEVSVRCSCGMDAKPAVRHVTDWNRLFKIFCGRLMLPSVYGL